MHVYGADSFIVAYACECRDGEVKLSHEHTAARWIDPLEYRERYFAAAGIEKLRAVEPRIAELSAAVRARDRRVPRVAGAPPVRRALALGRSTRDRQRCHDAACSTPR